MLLTGPSGTTDQYALRTMVDGLVELRLDAIGMEAARTIEVTKFRGSAVLLGRHLFEITEDGVTIYPRIESHRGRALAQPVPGSALPAAFDIEGLDAMLGSGLRAGSLTMLLGTPGSGKTLLGLSFLAAGAREGEKGLYFGFFETPSDLGRKADAVGIGVRDHVKSGVMKMMWQSPLDAIADALAENVLSEVRDRGVRRLFIDGLGGFKDSLVYPARSRRFLGALCNELRSMGVVTILSDETRTLSELDVPERGFTAILDNVIFLRHVEVGREVTRLISVLKLREGAGDSSLREFSIDARGFLVSSASRRSKPKRRRPKAR